MLQNTDLITKPLADKKKTINKIKNMIKKYKDLHTIIERSDWEIDVETYKKNIVKNTRSIVNEYILKKCS